MSITPIIAELERQGILTRYVPWRTLRPARRRLFMTPRMTTLLNNLGSPVNLLVGRGHVEAALTLWTVGDHIYDDGRYRPGPGFLKRLEKPPPEVWEFRVTNPRPQARIFGRFAEPDTFIATDMHERDFLGKKGSANWIDTCDQCASDWAAIFPKNAPLQGTVVGDYVTEKYDDFPLA